MARLTRAALVLAVALGLSACETAKGFVQDSENLGDALSDGL